MKKSILLEVKSFKKENEYQMKRLLFLGITLFILASVTASYAAILVTNQSGAYTAPTATITYRLNTYGNVTVYIKEAAGNTTIKTINAGAQTAGVHNVIWNGVKDGGAKATTGQYYAVASIDVFQNALTEGSKS